MIPEFALPLLVVQSKPLQCANAASTRRGLLVSDTRSEGLLESHRAACACPDSVEPRRLQIVTIGFATLMQTEPQKQTGLLPAVKRARD